MNPQNSLHVLLKNSSPNAAHQAKQSLDLHLHVHCKKGGKYVVCTDSERWCWHDFLYNGLHHSRIYRYQEYEIDDYGIETLITDKLRA